MRKEITPRRNFLRAGIIGTSSVLGPGGWKFQNEGANGDESTVECGEAESGGTKDSSESRAQDDLSMKHDSRKVHNDAGKLLDRFSSLNEWTADKGTAELVSDSRSPTGRAARISVGPSESRGRIFRSFPEGIDLSSRDVSIAVKPGNADSFRMELLAPNPDNKVDI